MTSTSTAIKPRVLIVVSGGVATYVADDGVDVDIFDFDDYESDRTVTHRPAKNFASLAEPLGIPTAEN